MKREISCRRFDWVLLEGEIVVIPVDGWVCRNDWWIVASCNHDWNDVSIVIHGVPFRSCLQSIGTISASLFTALQSCLHSGLEYDIAFWLSIAWGEDKGRATECCRKGTLQLSVAGRGGFDWLLIVAGREFGWCCWKACLRSIGTIQNNKIVASIWIEFPC